jgi:hypothetical protein
MAMLRLIVLLLILATAVAIVYYLVRAKFPRDTSSNAHNAVTVDEAYAALVAVKDNSKVDVREALDAYTVFVDTVMHLVPDNVTTYLLKSKQLAVDINTMSVERNIMDERRTLLYFTLIDYIPTSVHSYVKFPLSQRKADSEATELIVKQLDSIVEALQKVQDAEVKDLKSTLEASALFLKQKFSDS